MMGAAIGIACGGAGFFLLRGFCHAVSRKGRICIWLALGNPLVLLLGMGLAAWLCPRELLWAGSGMAAFLVIGAMAEMLCALRREKRRAQKRPGLEPGGEGAPGSGESAPWA